MSLLCNYTHSFSNLMWVHIFKSLCSMDKNNVSRFTFLWLSIMWISWNSLWHDALYIVICTADICNRGWANSIHWTDINCGGIHGSMIWSFCTAPFYVWLLRNLHSVWILKSTILFTSSWIGMKTRWFWHDPNSYLYIVYLLWFNFRSSENRHLEHPMNAGKYLLFLERQMRLGDAIENEVIHCPIQRFSFLKQQQHITHSFWYDFKFIITKLASIDVYESYINLKQDFVNVQLFCFVCKVRQNAFRKAQFTN